MKSGRSPASIMTSAINLNSLFAIETVFSTAALRLPLFILSASERAKASRFATIPVILLNPSSDS
jgi:hypothetical protein